MLRVEEELSEKMTNVYAIDEIDNLDLKDQSWEPAYTVDFAPE